MKITAVTRYKHAGLYAAIEQAGFTQAELARRSGVPVTKICSIINLKERPSAAHADAIQRALGECGVYIDVLAEWPETFRGFGKPVVSVQTAEVSVEHLSLGCREVLQIAAPEPEPDNDLLYERVNFVVEGLNTQQQTVVRKHFFERKSLPKIAEEVGLSQQRVRQIYLSATRKLRHPARLKMMFPPEDFETVNPEDIDPEALALASCRRT